MAPTSDLVRTLESLLGISLGDSVSDSLVVIVTTSVALLIGLLAFVWRKSSDRSKEVKPVPVPSFSSVKEEEDDVDISSGKTKVTVFFGTQTGTAEGFAKVQLFVFSRFLPFFFGTVSRLCSTMVSRALDFIPSSSFLCHLSLLQHTLMLPHPHLSKSDARSLPPHLSGI